MLLVVKEENQNGQVVVDLTLFGVCSDSNLTFIPFAFLFPNPNKFCESHCPFSVAQTVGVGLEVAGRKKMRAVRSQQKNLYICMLIAISQWVKIL